MYADELDIVTKAQRGDQDAFGELMRAHTSAVYNFACRFLSSKDDVDDVVQDVFLKAYQSLPRFDPSQKRFRNWLIRITANTSIDLIRKQKTVREHARSESRRPAASSEPAGLAERFYHNSNELMASLQHLPARERQVVLLFYYHDLTHREISEVLHLPLGTVKSRLRSAISRLSNELL